ncbi:GTP cyclohydrolase FolE2 [Eikenella corrodens]|jgi:TIGR00294 family protein|uniref:GTP cyclohydrolase FolE2 n=2 Tax=Eikenella corrodens TaxID=539 RepID=A0A1A9RCR5_EIKCO|nr:GTP cyclohydrolase FolE2 [Eikenella corrodens]EEG24032.1 TIGR00294 family protein [Eikenella corrodens ATCC 23834]MDU1346539.1 GTP cyclohydrolase FolE2 [Eikenella corrodens]OAM15740.1 GTP cyclohydrolase [Eikenella corrodens]OAM16053.1 GTP cyclohydrolase [Eikenella corrodens]OAM16696.1 GTP cyclohydrolase [Eikenella corrodens]
MNAIADVQSSPDQRNMPINQVGIKDLHFPLQIQSAEGVQHTIARIGMTVALPASQKGTHMSRFVALMEERQHLVLDFTSLHQLTLDMLERLDAQAGRIHISFPFFRKKAAPVSGITSFLDYAVTWQGEVPASGEYSHQIKVLAPVTSLCPCSKEISQYGAHNQRSHVTVTLTCHKQEVSIEEIIDLVENKASCQLYGLLKRPDEKYVTEHAYENPKFVEDMVRDIAVALKNDPRIDRFSVESENFESIHNHSAYALIEYP